jgi:rod shape-determining protein MreD
MVYLRYFIVGLILLLLHISVVPLIAIEGIPPDLMLIFIVYIALKNGQITGSVAGFVTGLLIDLTVDFTLGLSALSKTIAGFVAGYFYNETKIEINTETFRFLGIVLFCSLINNLIYFSLDIFDRGLSDVEILKFILGRSIYTSILSLIPIFTTSRRLR